jgi:cytochrome b
MAPASSYSSIPPAAKSSASFSGCAMTNVDNTIEASGARPPATVKVWGLFIRAFHWSLVALFVVVYVTGDEIERVHIAAGYAIAGLIVLRLAWGVIGPRHARFSTFVRTPHEVFAYLRAAILFKASRYLGHNPAGGAMILALLAMLGATCITGYMMTTDAYWGSKWLEHIHEVMANLTVVLIVLHVLGVLFASFEHRENLVKAMITGLKRAS